jgi:hypothetical protein
VTRSQPSAGDFHLPNVANDLQRGPATGLEVVEGILLAQDNIQCRDNVSTLVKYVSRGFYALSSGKNLPTFRQIIVPTSSLSSSEDESSFPLLDLGIAGIMIFRNVLVCRPVGTV